MGAAAWRSHTIVPAHLFNAYTIRGQIEWDQRPRNQRWCSSRRPAAPTAQAGRRISRLADRLQFAPLYLELQQRARRSPQGHPCPAGRVPGPGCRAILQPLIENRWCME